MKLIKAYKSRTAGLKVFRWLLAATVSLPLSVLVCCGSYRRRLAEWWTIDFLTAHCCKIVLGSPSFHLLLLPMSLLWPVPDGTGIFYPWRRDPLLDLSASSSHTCMIFLQSTGFTCRWFRAICFCLLFSFSPIARALAYRSSIFLKTSSYMYFWWTLRYGLPPWTSPHLLSPCASSIPSLMPDTHDKKSLTQKLSNLSNWSVTVSCHLAFFDTRDTPNIINI